MGEYIGNPGFYASPKNIRPLTEMEHIAVLFRELSIQSSDSELAQYIETVRNIRDDLGAVRKFLMDTLYSSGAHDALAATIEKFAEERRPETGAAIAIYDKVYGND